MPKSKQAALKRKMKEGMMEVVMEWRRGVLKRSADEMFMVEREDKIDMLEFVKANPVLNAREHVYFVEKAKKDALLEKIGEQLGRSGQDVKHWFQSQRNMVWQAHFRLEKVRLKQELPED